MPDAWADAHVLYYGFCVPAPVGHFKWVCLQAHTHARTLPPLDHAPIRQRTPYDGPDTHWELLSRL